jgi:hypothetical protein
VNTLEQQIKEVEEVWQNRVVNLQHHLHSRFAQERARLEEYKLIAAQCQEELTLLQAQYRNLLHKNKLLHSMCNTLLLQLDYTYRALTKSLFASLKANVNASTHLPFSENEDDTLSSHSSSSNHSKKHTTSTTTTTVGSLMVSTLKKATTWLAQRRQLVELTHCYKTALSEVEHLKNELDKQQRKAAEMEDYYDELLRATRAELWKLKEQWDTTDEYCRSFSSLFRQLQTILEEELHNSSTTSSSTSNEHSQQLIQKLLRLINYHFTDNHPHT